MIELDGYWFFLGLLVVVFNLVKKVKKEIGLFFLFVESIVVVKEGVLIGVVLELSSIGKLVVRKVKLILEKKLVMEILVVKMDIYLVVVNVFMVI